MSEENIKAKINHLCKKSKKEFAFPKIYIDEDNDLHYNSLNNIFISSCYIERNGLFYNNNEVLKDIVAYKKELDISDLYLEFDGRDLSVVISPEYNSISEDYFKELCAMSFTIGMINKVQRETDQLVRCQTTLNYLKLLDVKKAFILIQYIIFHNLMTISEVLNIFKLYLCHLDEVSEFSNVNNIMFLQKALFCQFSINDIYFFSPITQ
ncbi:MULTISPECIES: hypothetical protein [unclassified Erwinia]|uniref:hypothetical protein n=1 Tax=unclassified Erwinia TaxID=2622719 RepID=UPI000C196AC8|nr:MULTISPECIES: hypothetical protein [unclassified Erwinia]PIJ48228.1 hypothetical protein BV501_17920 [Erwinia sp. OAMSP11]PIJ68297.1 hypothetical protein BK416_16595 [Erwinia sp. OLSSP12]PIJ83114.1 hypothetical protein BLD47_06025 [Erwinia sp. OLCASP19]PIJ85712.1 hypothetical protein BLD46_06055 [Erwinia sp. OLMTSP26]PIJ87637.1 hypothetical protein BLD49_05060 [Erwinia sp. OLMDSP33]